MKCEKGSTFVKNHAWENIMVYHTTNPERYTPLDNIPDPGITGKAVIKTNQGRCIRDFGHAFVIDNGNFKTKFDIGSLYRKKSVWFRSSCTIGRTLLGYGDWTLDCV